MFRKSGILTATRTLTHPAALRPGDTIGICTPSFPAHVAFRAKYLHGVDELTRLGFRVIEGSLTARATAQGARSGTPQERAAEINELFSNREVRAIITTIGGYHYLGAAKILAPIGRAFAEALAGARSVEAGAVKDGADAPR